MIIKRQSRRKRKRKTKSNLPDLKIKEKEAKDFFLQTKSSKFHVHKSKKPSRNSSRMSAKSNTLFAQTFHSNFRLTFQKESSVNSCYKKNSMAMTSQGFKNPRKPHSRSLSSFSLSAVKNYEKSYKKLEEVFRGEDLDEKRTEVDIRNFNDEKFDCWYDSRVKLILREDHDKQFKLKDRYYLQGSIDCRNRYLPMDFVIDTGIASFEVYIKYNSRPTTENYDKVFYDEKIRLPEEDQKFIKNDFSIKFMILAISEMKGTLSVRFHGVKNKVFIRSMPKFNRIKYEKFINMKLYIPPRIEFKKNLEKVNENKKTAYIHNPSYRGILSLNRANVFDKKLQKVLSKKSALQAKDLRRRKANLDKFIKRKKMKMKITSIVMKKLKREVAVDVWVKLIWFLKVMAETKEKYYKRKREKFDLYILNKKAAMIGIMFRAKMMRRMKSSMKLADVETTKYALNQITRQIREKSMIRARQKLGQFFKFMARSLKVNQVIFEYKIGFEIIRKRWQNHMRKKKKSYKRFKLALDRAQMTYVDLCKDIDGADIKDVQYLSPYITYELFILIFNHQLCDHYKVKFETKQKYDYDLLKIIENSIKHEEKEKEREVGPGKDGRLFDLKEIVKFDKCRKALKNSNLYFLYELILDNYRGRAFREFYKNMGYHSNKGKTSRVQKLLKKRASIVDKNSPTLKKKSSGVEIIDEGQEDEIEIKFSKYIMKKVESANFMNFFKIKLDRKFMMVVIVTIIKYYKERPREFKDINALRLKQLSEQDNFIF